LHHSRRSSLDSSSTTSHPRWFPSLPLRNLVLVRAQFRNATGGMSQQVKCLP
jgi:hypothetical protein